MAIFSRTGWFALGAVSVLAIVVALCLREEQRVVIVVGGGAAGMSAALEAARGDPKCRVLLFDKGVRGKHDFRLISSLHSRSYRESAGWELC